MPKLALQGAVSASAALTLLAIAPPARAFCRTITQPLPASYDPAGGCYEPKGSIPLWWANACVGWSVQQSASKQIAYADADAAVTRAFARWSTSTCGGGEPPSIAASDDGAVTCDEIVYSSVGPNQNAILFRDDSWPHDDPNNTLALTTVTFDQDTGELYDADVEINTSQNTIVTTSPVPAGAFDFDSIITHEAGHFLGLAHSPDVNAVMYAHYRPGSTELTTDDVAGICAIYEPGGDRVTTLAGATQMESACDPTPRHGFGSECGAAGGNEPGATTTTKSCAIAQPGKNASGRDREDAAWIALGGLVAAAAVARRRGAKLGRVSGSRRAIALAGAIALGAGSLATFLAEPAAHASVSIAVMLDELVRDSTAAVTITPLEQRSYWSEGRIYTYTRVKVDRSIAGQVESGDANDGSFWIRTMGGTVDHVGQQVEGEAVLTMGESALVFVHPLATEGRGVYVVTARGQGQFPIVTTKDAKSGAARSELVRSSVAGMLMPPSATRVAALSDLRARAGVSTTPPLAAEALHHRAVDDAARDVAEAWTRVHGAK